MTTLVLGSTGMLGSAIMSKIPDAIAIKRDHCNLLSAEEVLYTFNKYKPTTVYHCAGMVGGILANINNQYDYLLNNTVMVINVIDCAIQSEIKELVNISSSCVYPNNCPQPMKEEYIMSGPVEPTNGGYAMAKLFGMQAMKYAKEKTGYNYITMIPCNLYGPNDNFKENGHVFASLVRKICDAKTLSSKEIVVWGDGTPHRELLHVSDCADAIIAAKNNLTSDLINIGSGVDISINQLIKRICRQVKWNGNVIYDKSKPNGMMKKLVDISQLKSIQWKPKIDLDTGIKQMIDTYRSL